MNCKNHSDRQASGACMYCGQFEYERNMKKSFKCNNNKNYLIPSFVIVSEQGVHDGKVLTKNEIIKLFENIYK